MTKTAKEYHDERSCGIGAFYDDETIDLLRVNGGVRLLYLVAIGITKS